MTNHKKDMGQFFTVSDELQRFVFEKVINKDETLLEPSFGAGHLLRKFKEYNDDYPMVCCEIDTMITPIVSFNSYQTVTYGDFTKQHDLLGMKFKTIIANPPYVKRANKPNLYIEFIELCFNCLDDNGGEMVFIVPSDFLKLTSAAPIISKMTANGSFTDFLFPGDEKLFEGASVDVVVFRYEKGAPQREIVSFNGRNVFCNVNKGIVTFSETNDRTGTPIDAVFNVYVGLVSGRDEIYRVPFGNIAVLTNEGRAENFIFVESFPTEDDRINAHLAAHKTELLGRKIRKFGENNWYEWGAPRNISSIRKHWGRPCIYVRNMTRNKNVCFTGTVQYFGGSLLCLVPKTDLSDSDIGKVVEFINSAAFQKDYIYAGRFKIGHKQISSAIVPLI